MAARDGLAARRRALGLTQDTLAEALQVERSTVARWEQGTSAPRPWHRRRLAQVLELAPDQLAPLIDSAAPTPMPVPTADGEHWEDPAGLKPSRPALRADADYVESIRQDGRRLVELDINYGGDDVTRLAVRAFKSAYQRLASGLYVRSVEQDLRAAVGELGQIAAWIAYDADRQPLARQLTNEALLLSRLAGDRHMELFELGQLAMQSVHLGRSGEALSVADEVIDSDPRSARVAAVFRVRRARALAQLGQGSRALNELDRAESMLSDGSDRDPDWTWWVDPSELAWHRAMSLASLDDLPAAVEQFQRAWELRPPSAIRARYNDAAHLLEAQVAVAAWRDAEATMGEALAGADDVRSSRTMALLRQVARKIERLSEGLPSTLSDSAHELSRVIEA